MMHTRICMAVALLAPANSMESYLLRSSRKRVDESVNDWYVKINVFVSSESWYSSDVSISTSLGRLMALMRRLPAVGAKRLDFTTRPLPPPLRGSSSSSYKTSAKNVGLESSESSRKSIIPMGSPWHRCSIIVVSCFSSRTSCSVATRSMRVLECMMSRRRADSACMTTTCGSTTCSRTSVMSVPMSWPPHTLTPITASIRRILTLASMDARPSRFASAMVAESTTPSTLPLLTLSARAHIVSASLVHESRRSRSTEFMSCEEKLMTDLRMWCSV
mmetsp:Transcript_49026/g.123331  ORF Transcript_49026/g.123331 Transcript_49026/m.123331 type:complete len:275 (-) Transcript_49026:469-1293(-)